VFLAYRRHVYRGVSHAVETQKVVDFAIVVPAEINRSQAQGVGHKIDILGDVTGLQKDKAVAPVAVLENRSLKDGRDENDQGGAECNLRLDHSLRDSLGSVSFAKQAKR